MEINVAPRFCLGCKEPLNRSDIKGDIDTFTMYYCANTNCTRYGLHALLSYDLPAIIHLQQIFNGTVTPVLYKDKTI